MIEREQLLIPENPEDFEKTSVKTAAKSADMAMKRIEELKQQRNSVA